MIKGPMSVKNMIVILSTKPNMLSRNQSGIQGFSGCITAGAAILKAMEKTWYMIENELKNIIVRNNFLLKIVLKATAHTILETAIPTKKACNSLSLCSSS
jgi:hypothetical protein